jgi:hypothetical protein
MSNDKNDAPAVSRRKFFALGSAGAIGLALPAQWTKPVMELVVTPAIAQEGGAVVPSAFLADIFRRSTGDFFDRNEGDKPGTTKKATTTPAPTTTGRVTTTPQPTTTTQVTTTTTTAPTTTISTDVIG